VVRKDRADATEELGDENGGVALCLDTVDPLQQRGRTSTSEGERRVRSEAHGQE
jgi:hypothetical protein